MEAGFLLLAARRVRAAEPRQPDIPAPVTQCAAINSIRGWSGALG